MPIKLWVVLAARATATNRLGFIRESHYGEWCCVSRKLAKLADKFTPILLLGSVLRFDRLIC